MIRSFRASATVTSSAPTVGVIGLGYGRAHVPAFQAAGCLVVAVCQRDRAAAEGVAKRYGVAQVFDRWEEMIERARPEIVVIATPPPLHHPIALRAFAAGGHVLCEKPLAMTAAEARAMAEAARSAGRVAMTSFNWRFTAAMQELLARARAGMLGRVLHLAGRWQGGRMADEHAPATWRADRAQAGHGVMGDQGVHLVDMIRALFGEFARVAAQAGVAYPSRSAPGVTRPADAEDYCAVIGELRSGAHVSLTTSRVARGVNEHALEVYGTRGAAQYRMIREGPRWWEGELRLSEGGAFRRVEPSAPPPASAGEGDAAEIIGKATIAPLISRLLEAIRTGAVPSPSFEDGARAQEVLDAVAGSVSRRAWVDLPG